MTSQSVISDFTKQNLIYLLNKGITFSVATARTAATATDFFKDIPISAGVLMNGAAIFDFKNERYLKTHLIPLSSLSLIFEVICRYPVSPFVYAIDGKFLNVYHKKLQKDYEIDFYTERASRRLKKYFEIPSYSEISNFKNIIYFCMLTDKTTAFSISEELRKIPDISVISYKDIHGDFYYVEVMSNLASKASGALWLKNYLNADSLTAFGDNLNDISLLKIADKKICVSNAVAELKEFCDKIIDSNDNDGVIKYILEAYNSL